jgi:hypothetical protein
MSSSFPSAEEVRSVLTTLLGKNVTVRGLPPGKPIAGAVFAAYGPDDGSVSVVCVGDIGFAASAGAALALMPASAAQESVLKGKLAAPLFENVCEILNVCGQLFNRVPGQRVALRCASDKLPELPPEARGVHAAPTQRLDLSVEITGYGIGRIAIQC